MESIVPSSINIPPNSATEYATEGAMSFRRHRFWFISFVMKPFKDIDQRTMDQPPPRRPANRRAG
jgi:hypothetical protein